MATTNIEKTRLGRSGLTVTRVAPAGTPERFVDWNDIRSVQLREARERTTEEAFARGAQIGYLVGIGVALLVLEKPDDLGILVYPIALGVAALPGGLVGGLIGLQFRGEVVRLEHCWP